MRIDLLSLCQRSEEAIPWLLSRLDLTGSREETLRGFEEVSAFPYPGCGGLVGRGKSNKVP